MKEIPLIADYLQMEDHVVISPSFIVLNGRYGLCFFSLVGVILLMGCGTTSFAPDTNEVIGVETAEDCAFGCIVGNNRKIGGREGETIEISRYTVPSLGISFFYASRLFYTGEIADGISNEIIHTGNSICLKENRRGTFVSGKEDGCVEFFPYEEREHLEPFLGTGTKNVYVDPSETFPEGKRMYGTNGIKKSIPDVSLYVVEYHCVACAPGPDFSWVQTIEKI